MPKINLQIKTALEEIAKKLGQPANNTIMLEAYGKFAFEIDLILKNIGSDKAKILDIGGGMGVNLLCVKKILPKAELFLIDRFNEYKEGNPMGESESGIRILKDSGISVTNQDFWSNSQLPFESNSFDVVTIFDVIEHLPGSPMAILKEIKRILKPDGKIILGGPNSISLMKRVKLFVGKHPYMPFDLWIGENYYSHYREYDKNEYKKLLDLAGFKNCKTQMLAEPAKTRLVNRFLNGKRYGILSPIFLILLVVYIIEECFPNLRASAYCIATS